MEQIIQRSVLSHFRKLEDPRVQGRCRHLLIDVLAIAICARICGAETFTEMEEFGIQRESWLKQFLELPNGVPSHDTIARVFSIIDSRVLENLFFQWARAVAEELGISRRLSLDGKVVKGTHRGFNNGSRPLALVNVFCHETGLTLGQAQAQSTGNAETKAAIECVELLDLQGTLVSVDAGLGKKSLLQEIRTKKGHYVIPIKSNSRPYFTELQEFIRNEKYWEVASTVEQSRDRTEIRECRVFKGGQLIEKLKAGFPDVKCIFEIKRTRDEKDQRYVIQQRDKDGKNYYEINPSKTGRKVTEETVLYASSRKLTPKTALIQVRTHWGIENQLHWSLDVIFNEDDCRVRNKVTARNLSLVRKIAFNLLQRCPEKGSKRVKMKRAAWNLNYLEQLIMSTF